MSQAPSAASTPMRPRVLVVDDEPNMCRSLAILVADEGRREVDTARSGEEALQKLGDTTDVLLCDLSMPGIDGIEVLRRVRAAKLDVQVIMMTAYSTVQSAVEAMRLGAHEYLIKPFTNEEVCAAVESALMQMGPSRFARKLRAGAPMNGRLGEMVGSSEPMRRLFRLVERAAEADATVLVTGDSGTGKELVARAIHTLGKRRDRAFVAVNCAALSAELLESELFGHERGAFTGAHKMKIGRLEQADGGTIFLDEIGDMSAALQTKLLRALEGRSFERVGGLETIHVDLRVIAATNQDLPRAIAEGRFREDLYYRLNVVQVTPPPLRERTGDLPLLCELFLAEKAAELGVAKKRLSPAAFDALSSYAFPGNVRELENLIERATVFAEGDEILPADLPLPSTARAPTPPSLDALIGPIVQDGWSRLAEVTKELERQLLVRALAAWGDRPNEEIARRLGTSRRVLELRLAEFGLKKR
ncbi:MAG TPA: sigma-54 dependent transcriptional regulator [Polyangia bacterium]|nr:sigma-54 dependent transcriptional regulator [Polyangia bacterium]